MLLGIDTGGTFTDFVCVGEEGVRLHKALSTPDNPARAILRGVEELGLESSELCLVHGSTVATNAILERKGVRTLLVTNRGLEDLIAIGRQTRRDLYELRPAPERAWPAPEDCLGVSGRIDADGRVAEALDPDDLTRLGEVARDYDAVAICTLFSFLHPDHERALADAAPETCFVSRSHEVLAERREYERAATTFLNAYVGPKVRDYLRHLERRLTPRRLHVMHSAGGLMPADEAGEQAVRLALSGPAGGLVAAEMAGRQLGEEALLTFDMGGTSTDVALVAGERADNITTEGRVADLPVAVPMRDIHTIGAGGGSIAWLDAAGLPQVGPESAGADPGPACYGRGGRRPTVTDANVALGRIPPDARLAGNLPLDVDAARRAVARLAHAAGLDVATMAEGIVRIAEENMAGALRVVSVERGHDPRRFALLCFGGAGGLHACSLAERMGMRRVVLPVASGAFSALGMLAAQRQCDLSVSRRLSLEEPNAAAEAEQRFAALEAEAAARMQGERISCRRTVELRYVGQGFQLILPFDTDREALAARFHERHAQSYGHALDRPVEIATLRLTATAETPPLTLPELPPASRPIAPAGCSEVHGQGVADHYRRAELRPGHAIGGPALVLEETSTLWLPPGWRLTVSAHGHLVLERGTAS